MPSENYYQWQMRDEDGNLLSPETRTDTLYNSDGTAVGDIILSNKIIAEPFSPYKSYEVGEYCIYGTILYKFDLYKPAGVWDSTLVHAVPVMNEVRSSVLKELYSTTFLSTITWSIALNQMYDDIYGIINNMSDEEKAKLVVCYGNQFFRFSRISNNVWYFSYPSLVSAGSGCDIHSLALAASGSMNVTIAISASGNTVTNRSNDYLSSNITIKLLG